ncbi:hypothetical protein F4819DRAFT_103912 [Hypoxylon fuscum]|nr:hypothetical protein F4819DRAFT_103912 [Hypoxylon fuscum]
MRAILNHNSLILSVVSTFMRHDSLPRKYSRCFSRVPKVLGPIGVDVFKEATFELDKPLILRASVYASNPNHTTSLPVPLPAFSKWFSDDKDPEKTTLSPYMNRFANATYWHEFVQRPGFYKHRNHPFWSWWAGKEPSSTSWLDIQMPDSPDNPRFARSRYPLSLLIAAQQYNKEFPLTPIGNIYMPLVPHRVLPKELQDDIPVPDIVQHSGRGLINPLSSIWIGLQNTYSPWHRDMARGLCVQLRGSKKVRLAPRPLGKKIMMDARAKFPKHDMDTLYSEHGLVDIEKFNKHAESIYGWGPERTIVYDAIWGPNAPQDLYAATVHAGDALYIPDKWWHSFKSGPKRGVLNASVNWFFD